MTKQDPTSYFKPEKHLTGKDMESPVKMIEVNTSRKQESD